LSVAAQDTQADASLWQLFARAAAQRGSQPALCFSDRTLSFTDLDILARRADAWLRHHGVGRGDVVALHLGKTAETYALILGALRIGAPYVCLDPASPDARLSRMLEKTAPKILFTASAALNAYGATIDTRAPGNSANRVADWSSDWPAPTMLPAAALPDDHPAYIMFTSGSTGEPKGAVIPHRGVAGLIAWAASLIDVPGAVTFSGLNPLHFDNSVFDVYASLFNGCALAPIETARLANPALWVRAIKAQGANFVFAVPTLFLMLDDIGLLTPGALPGVRRFMFGGEGFPIARLAAFQARFTASAQLLNVYGPTETSCICSSLEVDHAAIAAAGTGFVSLGRMHRDFEWTVLDAAGAPVAPGVPGELWIGGGNVGLGYIQDAAETARRFCSDPRPDRHARAWSSRFYRTGDLVRADATGALWFVGRADNQIKFRGHRIELEEIDHILGQCPGVRRAAAVLIDGAGGAEIAAAVDADGSVETSQLRAWCGAHLPSYMRPAVLVRMSDLPVNANGKLDRRRLHTLLSANTSDAPRENE
jgi:D-alanine--poly(phosphoribitol) ligase subunit 1